MNDNIPGCSHVDSLITKPATEDYRKGWARIDWSKKLTHPGDRDGQPDPARSA